MNSFSQAVQPTRYSYALPEKGRSRILHTLKQHKSSYLAGRPFDFLTMLNEVGQQLVAKNGGLRSSMYEAARMSDHPVINHFFFCNDEEAMEFIATCFVADTMGGDSESAKILVEAINRILEEEGIGYELTPPVTIDTGKPANLFGRLTGRNFLRTEFPRIVKKGPRTIHEFAVKPALETLTDSRLSTANSELLDAFEKVRKGNYPAAITSCGAAFESVLKTICDVKGWIYDPNKDTCAKLVGICRDKGLFFPFYAPIFEGVGTLRNKIGDAHGKGPKPEFVAAREHAEHMIAMTCTHIDFLIRQAGF